MPELLTAFQTFLRDDEKSPHTIAAYLTDVRGFLACVAAGGDPAQALGRLTRRDVVIYKDWLAAEYEVSTRNRKLVALDRFLEFVRASQIVAVPPVPIKFFEEHQRHINRYIAEAEVGRFVREAEQQEAWRDAALFAGLFYSGARVSELLQIRTSQATQMIVRIVGKRGTERNLYLSNEELRRTWQRYLEAKQQEPPRRKPCPYFFSGRRGRLTRQTVGTLIKEYAGRIRPRLKAEKAHPHAFRHGCGMWLKRRGHTIDQVADILGHKSLDTTRIYFRDTEAELLRMMR